MIFIHGFTSPNEQWQTNSTSLRETRYRQVRYALILEYGLASDLETGSTLMGSGGPPILTNGYDV